MIKKEYRLIQEGDSLYTIYEVYVDYAGEIVSIDDEPCIVSGSSKEDVINNLYEITEDIKESDIEKLELDSNRILDYYDEILHKDGEY